MRWLFKALLTLCVLGIAVGEAPGAEYGPHVTALLPALQKQSVLKRLGFLAEQAGSRVRIAAVLDGSPFGADLQPGDEITSVNDIGVGSIADILLAAQRLNYTGARKVVLYVERNGARLSMEAKPKSGIPLSLQLGTAIMDLPRSGGLTERDPGDEKPITVERLANILLANPGEEWAEEIAARPGLLAQIATGAPVYWTLSGADEGLPVLDESARRQIALQKLGAFGWLGFAVVETPHGLLIAENFQGRFPDVRPGERLVRIAGRAVRSIADVMSVIVDLSQYADHIPNREITITILRFGAHLTLKAATDGTPLDVALGKAVRSPPATSENARQASEAATADGDLMTAANLIMMNANREWAETAIAALLDSAERPKPKAPAGDPKLADAAGGPAKPLRLFGQTAPEDYPIVIVPQFGHSTVVRTIRFSPDGMLMATGGIDATVLVWRVATGELLRAFRQHSQVIRDIAFSPDGRSIASASEDRTVKVWETATGKLLFSIDRASEDWAYFTAAKFSDDGSQLVTGDQTGVIAAWDVEKSARQGKPEPVWSVNPNNLNPVMSIALVHDGKGVRTLHEFSKTVEIDRSWTDAELDDALIDVGVLSDDASLAVTRESLEQDRFTLWDMATRKKLLQIESDDALEAAAAFSPHGAIWAAGPFAGKIELRRSGATEPIAIIPLTGERQRKEPAAMAFTPDGARLAFSMGNVIRLVSVDDGSESMRFGGGEKAGVTTMAADGSTMLTSSSAGATLWRLEDNREIRSFDPEKDRGVSGGRLSADGKLIVTGVFGGAKTPIEVMDADTGRSLGGLPIVGAEATDVAFSPDGRSVFIPGGSGEGYFYDLASRKRLSTVGKPDNGRIWSVAYSADGSAVVAAATSDDIEIVSAPDGKVLASLSYSNLPGSPLAILKLIGGAGFSADSRRLVTGDWDGNLVLFDWKARKVLANKVIPVPIGAAGYLSPDLIYAAGWDGVVRLYDADLSGEPMQLPGHEGLVTIVRLDAKRNVIVVVTDNGSTRQWDLRDGSLLATTLRYADGEWVRMTPEGFFDGTLPGGKRLVVVRGTDSFTIDQAFQTLLRPDLVAAKIAGDPRGEVAAAVAKTDLATLFASGQAPDVSIRADFTDSNQRTAELSVAIADAGGGVGRSEIRVNGVTQAVRADGATAFTARVDIEPGDNQIEVIAYNKANLIASRPATADIVSRAKEPRQPPKLFVLAVGINEYREAKLRLGFAAGDARAFAERIARAAKGSFSGAETTLLLDQDATTAGIEAAFRTLAGKVGPRDVFVFYAASHGTTENGRYHMIPQEFTINEDGDPLAGAITQEMLGKWMATIRARRSLLLYDTCESGGLANAAASPISGLERITAVTRMTRSLGRTVIGAATGDALEGFRGHGVFTFALLSAFAEGDANRNGAIEVSELAAHVRSQVPMLAKQAFDFEQEPEISVLGDDFRIGRKLAK